MNNLLLQDEQAKGRMEAKYNLFKFQDLLVAQLAYYSQMFISGDMMTSFDVLQEIYLNTSGFFNDDENAELKKVHQAAQTEYFKLQTFIISRRTNKQHGAQSPQLNNYGTLLDFKMALMKAMAKHQLLIPVLKKGMAGAAEL